MIIYLDMDEVVADWFGYVSNALGKTWAQGIERIPREDWDRLKDSNPRVYRDLPLKQDAMELVRWVLTYAHKNPEVEVRFLSAVPAGNDMPWAFQDKVWWAHQYFPGIPVFLGPYSKDKQHHCQPGDILIDDRWSNIESWLAAGGHGHQYKNWPDCKQWLEKLLNVTPQP